MLTNKVACLGNKKNYYNLRVRIVFLLLKLGMRESTVARRLCLIFKFERDFVLLVRFSKGELCVLQQVDEIYLSLINIIVDSSVDTERTQHVYKGQSSARIAINNSLFSFLKVIANFSLTGIADLIDVSCFNYFMKALHIFYGSGGI